MTDRLTTIRTAILDPGQFAPRIMEPDYESIGEWGARAVEIALKQEFRLVDEIKAGEIDSAALLCGDHAAMDFAIATPQYTSAEMFRAGVKGYIAALALRRPWRSPDDDLTRYPSVNEVREFIAGR